MLHRRQKTLQPSFICLLLLMSGPLWAGAAGLTSEEATRYAELEDRALQTFTNVDLADYLQLRSKLLADDPDRPSPAEEIGHFARKSLGQTYRLNAVRWDLAESDCVVFTERCIAMACAKDWESYYRISERLRHKDGIVEYRNRNFHTLGDWMPNNGWLFQNVSDQLGPEGSAATFTHVVRPKVFEEFPAAPGSKYTRIVFKGSDYQSSEQEILTEAYIPAHSVHDVESALLTGDIVLVLRAASNGHLGCDHMGLIVLTPEGVMFLHSAPPTIRQEPLLWFPARCPWVVGLQFLRLHKEARDMSAQEVVRLCENVAVPMPTAKDDNVSLLRCRRTSAGE